MKIDFYVDVWPGCEIKWLTASTTKSSEKIEGSHRIKLVADIPDWMLAVPKEPDHVVTAIAQEV